MANRTNRTPTDGTSADRRKERLADPEDSGHFNAALTPDVWAGCPVVKHDLGDRYRCDFAQPHPVDGIHSWVLDDPYDEADGIGRDTTGSLPAVPPSDVQAADPPATPDASGETPEPSHTPDVAAGSGGRVGRPLCTRLVWHGGNVYRCTLEDGHAGMHDEELVPRDLIDHNRSTPSVPVLKTVGSGGGSLVRPDARESVLAALGGVYNPAADPGYAIRLAEDFARLMVMGPHFARLVQANADKEPPDPADVRGLYRKLRQIAATHGIDLDDNGGES